MNKKMSIIAIIILLIDQLSKYLIDVFNVHFSILNNLLRITYTQNDGAAFSILSGHQTIIIIASIVLLILVYNLMFSFENNKLNDTAFGLMIGGTLGNLIDRIMFSYVRDFIDVNLFNFAIFNIADMAIVIGVILLFISSIKGSVKNGNKSTRTR